MRKQMADNKKLTYESPEDEEVDRFSDRRVGFWYEQVEKLGT